MVSRSWWDANVDGMKKSYEEAKVRKAELKSSGAANHPTKVRFCKSNPPSHSLDF
jgi:hypothetical protein